MENTNRVWGNCISTEVQSHKPVIEPVLGHVKKFQQKIRAGNSGTLADYEKRCAAFRQRKLRHVEIAEIKAREAVGKSQDPLGLGLRSWSPTKLSSFGMARSITVVNLVDLEAIERDSALRE